MRYFIFLLLLFSTPVNTHHLIAFVSCGFKSQDPLGEFLGRGFDTKIAPNLRLAVIRIDHIEMIRGYSPGTYFSGPTCSHIYLNSGEIVFVIGSVENILKRLEKSEYGKKIKGIN